MRFNKLLFSFSISLLLAYAGGFSSLHACYITEDDATFFFSPDGASISSIVYSDPYYKGTYLDNVDGFANKRFALKDITACPKDTVLDSNVLEWQREIGAGSYTEVANLVYRATVPQAEALVLSAGAGKLKGELSDNKAAQKLAERKMTPHAEYLLFAKRNEKEVAGNSDSWDYEEPLRDAGKLNAVKRDALDRASKVKNSSAWLYRRYLFLAIRAAHYAGDHNEALRIYDTLAAPTLNPNVKDSIYYRTLSLKAGALRRTGKLSEALYHFANIFLESPDFRKQARNDLKYLGIDEKLSNSVWNGALAYAKSGSERSNLRFVRFLLSGEPSISLIEELYSEMPASLESSPEYTYTLLLAVMRIEQQELELFEKKGEIKNPKQAIRLAALAKSSADRIGSRNKDSARLWKLSAAYLYLLAKQERDARALTDEVTKENANSSIVKADATTDFINSRLAVMGLLFQALSKQAIRPDFESEFLKHQTRLDQLRKANKYHDQGFHRYLFDSLSKRYKSEKKDIQSFLADLSKEPARKDMTFLNKLERFQESKTLTSLEKYLVANYGVEQNTLRDLQAIQYLLEVSPQKAESKYKEVSKAYLDKLNRDYTRSNSPFQIHNVEKYNKPDRKENYSKYNVSQKLAILKAIADGKSITPAQKALLGADLNVKGKDEALFRMANAYYNMSYYGNWWILTRDYWSINGPIDADESYTNTARSLFQQVARDTKDKELAAKSLYMIALIELQLRPNEIDDATNRPKSYSKAQRDAFKEIREKYQDTRFFKETIKECYYYHYAR